MLDRSFLQRYSGPVAKLCGALVYHGLPAWNHVPAIFLELLVQQCPDHWVVTHLEHRPFRGLDENIQGGLGQLLVGSLRLDVRHRQDYELRQLYAARLLRSAQMDNVSCKTVLLHTLSHSFHLVPKSVDDVNFRAAEICVERIDCRSASPAGAIHETGPHFQTLFFCRLVEEERISDPDDVSVGAHIYYLAGSGVSSRENCVDRSDNSGVLGQLVDKRAESHLVGHGDSTAEDFPGDKHFAEGLGVVRIEELVLPI
ncbi:hypothetical protein KL950_004344 [Ogataea haglerorum]|nr:hypothetical protein KL950_004344 [Ogataea haglerorum]